MKVRPAKTVKEVLIAAKWILENYGWHKGANYKDEEGFSSLGMPENPVSFCAYGAVLATEASDELKSEAECLLTETVGMPITEYNDDFLGTKKKVLKVFDRAIKKAIKEAS